MNFDFRKPILLQPDNFTPLTRTPWAGNYICTNIKSSILPDSSGKKVGESWEFSCDPKFPSIVRNTSIELAQLVTAHPVEILGGRPAVPFCEILVKLLNAAQPLSLQIHPTDEDPDLTEDECGKPESWLILHSEPGAGLYLGYNRPLSRTDLHDLLLRGDAAKSVLQFVPVKPGDYFEIEPGVPHAIGPGVTLLEPQRIIAGKSGKTFRMWDWGRRYDDKGVLDLGHGRPRELHVEQSLKLTDPMRQVGDEFVASCRRRPSVRQLRGAAWFAYPENPYYQLHVCEFSAEEEALCSHQQGYGVALVLQKKVTIAGITMTQGESALIPAQAFPLALQGEDGAKVALIAPHGSDLRFDAP